MPIDLVTESSNSEIPKYWLCVTSKENWSKIDNTNVWGVPEDKFQRNMRQLARATQGDRLVFYIKSPIRCIVGIYKITSSMFVDNNEIWKDRAYPYRVRIKPLLKNDLEKDNYRKLLPLSKIIKKLKSLSSFSALQGKSMIQITKKDFDLIFSGLEEKIKSH